MSFGNDFRRLFENAEVVDYNDKNMESAKQQIQNFQADMGGTEIYDPLN